MTWGPKRRRYVTLKGVQGPGYDVRWLPADPEAKSRNVTPLHGAIDDKKKEIKKKGNISRQDEPSRFP